MLNNINVPHPAHAPLHTPARQRTLDFLSLHMSGSLIAADDLLTAIEEGACPTLTFEESYDDSSDRW